MAGFAGVDKVCRRPCTGHGGGNLAGDVSGFAHATDDQPPAAIQNQGNGGGKVAIEPRLERLDGSGFDAECLATEIQSAFRGEAGGRWAWVHGLATVMMPEVYPNRENALERAVTCPPVARCLGACRGHLPSLQSAAGARVSFCWQPDRTACAQPDGRRPSPGISGRIRRRLPDVLDRTRVFAAQTLCDEAHRLRAGL